jgi:Polyketide cyclase / dehydrase and lipid transport
MISIVETVRIPHAPERIWRFFSEVVEDRYPEWHSEHLRWRWLRGRPLEQGAVWFADEWIGRKRIAGRFIVDEVHPGRYFSYRLAFPSSLVRAGGSFRLEPRGDGGCELIQDVHMGFSLPLLGRLIDLVIAAVVPVRDLRRHMREEQANLIPLLASVDEVRGDEKSNRSDR